MSDNVGEVLRDQRQRLGYSIEDASAATRIRARMLEALEDDHLEALPNPAYVKGYIISYARFLDLEPEPLVTSFMSRFDTAPEEPVRRRSSQALASRDKSHATPAKAAVIAALLIGIVALAVWGVGRANRDSDAIVPIPQEPTSSVPSGEDDPPAIDLLPEETGDVEGSVPETITAPVTAEPFSLEVRVEAGSASWLRVTIDGLKAYEGTLTGPQTKQWDVTDEATVRVGMPSAVTVLRDGEEVEMPTDANTPEITLQAE